jgi:hypothetical protein
VVSNGGEITNKGLEVSLNARAIENPNLRWEIGVTWARTRTSSSSSRGADYVGPHRRLRNSVAVKGPAVRLVLRDGLGSLPVRDQRRRQPLHNLADEDVDVNALCRRAMRRTTRCIVDTMASGSGRRESRVRRPEPNGSPAFRNNFTLWRKVQISSLVDVKKGA